MRTFSTPGPRGLCEAALLLVAAACNGSDVTSPSTGDLQVTTATGGSPSVTGRIAFVSDRDGNNEIYVVSANGRGATRLTNDPANDGQPAWSPDGTKIAFVSDRFDGNDEIYVMNADGSGVIRLTTDPALERAPAWSPDGKKIAFVSNRADQHDEIYVMKADGKGVTRLTTNLPFQGCGGTSRRFEESPAWSPDGRKIAFLHKTTCFSFDIDVMNADGTGITRLTNAGFAAKLAWGGTGKIAFDPSVQPGVGLSDREIDVVTVSDATVTQLTDNTVTDAYPSWSPDGTKIAFVSDREARNFEIYVMNADGSGVTRLTSNPAFDGEPAWGP